MTGEKSCYVLEPGVYHIWSGNSVRHLQEVYLDNASGSGEKEEHGERTAGYLVEKLTVTERLTEAAGPEEEFLRMKPGAQKPDGTYELSWETVPVRSSSLKERIRKNLPPALPQTGNRGIRLADVKAKRASMEEFIAQLDDSELAAIVRGEGMCSPRVTPGRLPRSRSNGQSGEYLWNSGSGCGRRTLRNRMDVGAKATQLPIGTLLACSWDTEMMERLYELEGQELLRNESIPPGAGINIHRHPLNGRNFEYFSEDPMVTGSFSAAMVRGIGKSGAQATVKHMACNTQEFHRHQVNAVVSERALREIYLKGLRFP